MSSHVTHRLFIAATAFMMQENKSQKVHPQIDEEDSDLSSAPEHFNTKQSGCVKAIGNY